MQNEGKKYNNLGCASETKNKMHHANTTDEQYYKNNIKTDVRPHQNKTEEQEWIFLSACANMLSHKRLRVERMLSPCTCPFYHMTKINQDATEIAREQKIKDTNVKKKNIAAALQKLEETIALREENQNITKGQKKEQSTQTEHQIKHVGWKKARTNTSAHSDK